MSDGRSSETRAELVTFVLLISTFVAASVLMALRLPA